EVEGERMDTQPLRIPVLSPEREPVGEMELPAYIAGQPPREHLLFEVVKMQLANQRQGTASTKTRGEVRGGGKKPWRQKGTGRARQGSTRSPIWVGGGITFGPRPRDFSMKLSAKMRQVALRSALSSKLADIVVVKDFAMKEPKTKIVATALKKLGVSGKTLV